jgi:hypothetical protein
VYSKPIQPNQIVNSSRPSREAQGQGPSETIPTERAINVPQYPHHVGRDDEDVLTIAEVAIILRCSKAHVHNLINGAVHDVPRLPAIPLGRRKVVRRGSLSHWTRDLERDVRRSAILPQSPEVDAVDACERKCHA